MEFNDNLISNIERQLNEAEKYWAVAIKENPEIIFSVYEPSDNLKLLAVAGDKDLIERLDVRHLAETHPEFFI